MQRQPNIGPPLKATLHDGTSARAIPVQVSPHGERLVVRGEDDVIGVAIAVLRRGAAVPAGLTLHRTDMPDWRLVLHDVPADGWVHRLPGVGRLTSRAAALYAGVAAALVGVAAIGWFQGPAIIAAAAPLVPHRVTEPIGRGYLVQLGRACEAPAGVAALQRLAVRLTPAKGFAEPVVLTVIDEPVVNALALPGGHVAIFRKLIDEAASPDEVAGVLAHELAHVDRQHPNQALIREMGLSLAARSLGGDIGGVADLTLLLHGTRAAEAEADSDAIVLMRAGHVSPRAIAGFFDRQNKKNNGLLPAALARLGDYGSTHPSDASRAALFRDATVSGTTAAMSDADWQALRSICR